MPDPARQRLHDGEFDWLFAAAEKAGVPVACLAKDLPPSATRSTERRCAGLPDNDVTDGRFRDWLAALLHGRSGAQISKK